jgi:ferredoxin
MRIADTIAQALGYQGRHFRVFDGADTAALDAALWSWPAALGVRVAATFAPTGDKRTTAALAIEHLARHAPVPQREIALPSGAPYGTIAVDAAKCTMCLACVGSCPEGAIIDNVETPQLRFIEAKCVQCGICARTCPENAIALSPRLNLGPEAKQPRVVNEAVIFKCIGCGKPVGSEKMVANMLGKLAGHSMFATPGALDRLKMCADCRVIDLMKNERGVDIRDL